VSPIHQNRSIISSCLGVFACLLIIPPLAAQAALPSTLEAIHLDWVCVTDAALVDDYAPLAVHREDQGLATLVVSLAEVILWSPASDDTTASLRWLSGVAHWQWGARFLLLGGSHATLPAPLHRISVAGHDHDFPTDAYYACLEGDWDTDGDELVAEWGEDAADPTIHLRVGRVPADDGQTVADVVAKIIAFENRTPAAAGGGLFVSSLMDINWDPGDPYPNWALLNTEALRDTALVHDPSLRIGTLFQGPDPEHPESDPLNEAAIVDSLGARAHDFVYCQLHGSNPAWELVFPMTITAPTFDPLAGAGHSFLLTMISGSVGDTRGEGVLRHLLTLPDGGAVAAMAPTGLSYLFPLYEIQKRLWPRLADRNSERLGDAFVAALTGFREDFGLANIPFATTYWYQTLFGDPATYIRPIEQQTSPAPPVAHLFNVRAVPNPFNPGTEIMFEVEEGNGGEKPVQVEIFDLQGRHVATLLERPLPPGPHRVTWHAEGSSGLYFARVTVDQKIKTIKLTLVK
jgi:hypothetical protein